LACHAFGLRATQPQAITVSRASGAIVLDGTFDATPPPAGSALPFRLTRNLQHFLAPHAIDGAFAAAACAAAGALAPAHEAPLELWLDYLADGCGGGGAPWAATGAAAAAAMRDLSPDLAVRKAEPPHGADVHRRVRELISAATSADALMAMPPAYQAWF